MLNNNEANRHIRTADRRGDYLLALIPLAVGALLLFPRLGDRCLWTDEAETALISSTLLSDFVPKAWDGRNLLYVYEVSFNSQLVATILPWLSYYVTAGSFAVLGESAFTARLPFVVASLASILATYFLVLNVSGDRSWAFVSALLLSLSVPFLLYARTCRYYALTTVLAVLLLHT